MSRLQRLRRDCRHSRLAVEHLDDRRMLSVGGYPDLPGLLLVDPSRTELQPCVS